MHLRSRIAGCAALTALVLAGCSDASDDSDSPDDPGKPDIPEKLAAAESDPVDDPYYPQNGEPYFDALRYDLNLDWDVASKTLTATATVTFRVTEVRDDVRLDFSEPLEVTAARLDGERIETTEDGEELTLDTGELDPSRIYKARIAYEGSPQPVDSAGSRSDLEQIGWTTENDGSVWTMQEPWGAYTWYPVNDHPSDKAYYGATITTNGGMRAVFNGRQVRANSTGDTAKSTWELDEPAAPYLITIAIGDYSKTAQRGPRDVPLTYWTRPQDAKQRGYLRHSPRILEWLEGHLGPYPFDTSGVVIVPSASGMETQTMVTLGDDARETRADYLSVITHEYAHQWFGNTVTPNNWKDLWLNEGLTMYLEARWNDHEGTIGYDALIDQWASTDERNRELYGPPGEYKQDEFASINVYISGAVMLDRIRREVGGEKFAEALRTWPQQHRNSSVDRGDFIDHMSEVTGADLDDFVTEWLTSPTVPEADF